MKITKIDVFQINDPANPIWKPVLCRIYTDEGLYGDGEAAMAYGIGSTGAYGVVQDLAKLIIGMDPLDNEVIWTKLYKQTFWGQNGGSVFTAGMSAIDLALWDIRGKFFNVPVYRLLGGKRQDNLRTYASQLQFGWQPRMEEARTLEDYVRYSKKAVAEGYDAIKIDFFTYKEKKEEGSYSDIEHTTLLPPERLNTIVQRVAAVREAVGPNVDIIIENHSMLDALSSIQFGRAVEPYNIFYYEEPNTPDPSTARYISRSLNIPIASGERIYTRWQYAKYFEDASVQVIQPDLGTCGGITEVKKIADMAYTYDVAVQIHACGSPISTAAALQIECVIPNFIIHEHHIVNLCDFNKRLCKYDYQPENGRFKVPELPGLGNELSDFVLSQPKATISGDNVSWSM
ncbi:mandelate racemase/muconate lactonizing enzyme family protein [Breznakiella homolactica]|uniref:Mandelate racemase/muconate lactonizing enzyme family protein n=1 Tax=Breznakiella homolactica TaxID=2798577 RepID=A0A7T8B9F8_9SPIR|nr:mandelate racemase/muconate lactonizing enzyme family protein [Breznakiella homolactica]QQO08402.1 mandelate racemase/muconate lactonizing enzyme family protein [Breznakiella homolactica]